MGSPDFKRVKAVFVEAVEKSGVERGSYLDVACAGDTDLRAEVEALLRASECTDALAGGGVPSFGSVGDDGIGERTPTVTEEPGTRIGRYKLLEEIGQGGFGVVFMAEQEQPVRRKVAVKVIKLGMDTRQVIARFEAERQALAMMDHPNIAKVLEAGSTESGRPFFVMELVSGVPLTDFCDESQLTPRERLELFVPVCQAVQHAHQKGIIHRDLKPSNVLVTMHDDRPVPKIIDFGIAKATQARLTERTLFTEFHQFLGTPQYTSPEQAQMSGLDIDTRADIYSLGVILYELLTGTTPLDARELRSLALADVQRMIRETEPLSPSTRLNTLGQRLVAVAAQRRADPKRLPRAVRGELDWIVMKCLEKDRTRRYETANGLAADIRRYLDDEPVVARPASAAYRARKFVQRHKTGVVGSAAIVAFLVFGIIGTTTGMVRSRAAEHDALAQKQLAEKLLADVRTAQQSAEREASRAKATADFLQHMLASPRPSDIGTGRDLKVIDVLDRGAQELIRLSAQPDVEFDARVILGLTYEDLGFRERANEQLVRARTLALRLYGPESDVTLGITADLARIMARAGHAAPAETICRESLDIARRVFGDDHRTTSLLLNNLGLVLIERQQYIEAEAIFRSLVAKARDKSLKLGGHLPVWMNNLAVVLRSQNKSQEAAETLAEVNAILKERREDDPILRGHAKRNLALSLMNAGKLEEAEAAYREALADQRGSLGIQHPNTRLTISEYATLLDRLGRKSQAELLRGELIHSAQSQPAASQASSG